MQWTLHLLFPSRCLRTSRVRNCRDDGGEDVDAFAKHRHVDELVVIMQQDRGVVHGREAKRGVCVVGKAGHRQGSNSYQTSTEGTEGIAEKCSTALKQTYSRRFEGNDCRWRQERCHAESRCPYRCSEGEHRYRITPAPNSSAPVSLPSHHTLACAKPRTYAFSDADLNSCHQ